MPTKIEMGKRYISVTGHGKSCQVVSALIGMMESLAERSGVEYAMGVKPYEPSRMLLWRDSKLMDAAQESMCDVLMSAEDVEVNDEWLKRKRRARAERDAEAEKYEG